MTESALYTKKNQLGWLVASAETLEYWVTGLIPGVHSFFLPCIACERIGLASIFFIFSPKFETYFKFDLVLKFFLRIARLAPPP